MTRPKRIVPTKEELELLQAMRDADAALAAIYIPKVKTMCTDIATGLDSSGAKHYFTCKKPLPCPDHKGDEGGS